MRPFLWGIDKQSRPRSQNEVFDQGLHCLFTEFSKDEKYHQQPLKTEMPD